MEALLNRSSHLTDEDMVLFESNLAICMTCRDWFNVSKLKHLEEYHCDSCQQAIIRPMKLSEFWIFDKESCSHQSSYFVARKQGDPKLYSIKMVEYENETETNFKELLAESELMIKLQHPGIAKAYRFSYKDGKAFLIMESMLNKNLKEHGQEYLSSNEQLIEWMIQLSETLEFLNSQGFIYRNLNPQNIILCDNQVKLTDFSMCVAHNQRVAIDTKTFTKSPSYLPPERIEGMVEDIRSDMYSLGLVFFYLANGYDYFDGPAVNILQGHLQNQRHDNESINPSLNPTFSAILDRLMSRKPEDRYSSYISLIDDLKLIDLTPVIEYKIKYNSPYS